MSHYTEMQEYKLSPKFAAVRWRNVGQETIDSLDEFLAWLEFDDDSPISKEDQPETFRDIENLVDLYLGRDKKKVAQGEQQLLDAWIKASGVEK